MAGWRWSFLDLRYGYDAIVMPEKHLKINVTLSVGELARLAAKTECAFLDVIDLAFDGHPEWHVETDRIVHEAINNAMLRGDK